MERTDQRSDSPALDEPSPAARFPLSASLTHQRCEVARAADGHHPAEGAELCRANARRNRMLCHQPRRAVETIRGLGLTLRDPGLTIGETDLQSSAPAHDR